MAALLLQISPLGLVITLILLLRRPPVQAALAGVAGVLLLWGLARRRRSGRGCGSWGGRRRCR